jgi:2-phosphosulfolactate phosphatase
VKVDIVGTDGLAELRDVAVIIDVLRAFTTAAHAFGAGASEIVLVETVEQAERLRAGWPGALLAGEVDGYPIDGFDFGNSPAEIARRDLAGRRLIQRTTSGTCAAIGACNASALLAASFVCAEATVRYIRRLEPAGVALVLSGLRVGSEAADDRACAEYLRARLHGEAVSPAPFLEQVRGSREARRFTDGDPAVFPAEDLELALEVDRFAFAMPARRRDGLLVLERAGEAGAHA